VSVCPSLVSGVVVCVVGGLLILWDRLRSVDEAQVDSYEGQDDVGREGRLGRGGKWGMKNCSASYEIIFPTSCALHCLSLLIHRRHLRPRDFSRCLSVVVVPIVGGVVSSELIRWPAE
jgi:hypothetical protein